MKFWKKVSALKFKENNPAFLRVKDQLKKPHINSEFQIFTTIYQVSICMS